MANIPTYDGFKIQAAQTPASQFAPVQSSGWRADGGQMAQNIGKTLTGLGGQMAQVSAELAREANQTIVNDALNRVKEESLRLTFDKEAGYKGVKGRDAVYRSDDKDLSTEYAENLQKYISQVGGDLRNDTQREAFLRSAADLKLNFQGNVQRHQAEEFRNYQLSVTEGVIANSRDAALLEKREPAKARINIERAKQAIYENGQIRGLSAEQIDANQREVVSDIHFQAIKELLDEGDTMTAQQYLDDNGAGEDSRKEMTASHILQASDIIMKQADLQTGVSAANSLFEVYQTRLRTSERDRLGNVASNISGAGLPFGVEAGATAFEDEEAKKAKIDEWVVKYKAAPSKIFAAYKIGDKELDKLVKEHGANWLEAAPQDVQEFVQNAEASFGKGEGKYVKPTKQEIKANLQNIEALNNPARMDAAVKQIEKLYKDFEDEQKAIREETRTSIFQQLYNNEGDLTKIAASELYSVDGQDLISITSFAERMAKKAGVDSFNPKTWAEILSKPQSDWLGVTPSQFLEKYAHELDNAHLEKGYAMIQAINADAGVSGYSANQKGTAIYKTEAYLTHALARNGFGNIDPSQNTDEQKFIRMDVSIAVQERIRNLEQAQKHPATDEQVEKMINEELGRVVQTNKSGLFAFGSKNIPQAYIEGQNKSLKAEGSTESAWEETYITFDGKKIHSKQVDKELRATIIPELRKSGVEVTEASILEYYGKLLKAEKQIEKERKEAARKGAAPDGRVPIGDSTAIKWTTN